MAIVVGIVLLVIGWAGIAVLAYTETRRAGATRVKYLPSKNSGGLVAGKPLLGSVATVVAVIGGIVLSHAVGTIAAVLITRPGRC